MADWITKKEKPKSWITKKEKPKSWITKKKKPTEWIKRKPPTDIRKKLTDAFAGGVKGKPHSSPEGQAASVGRTIKRIGQERQQKFQGGGRIGLKSGKSPKHGKWPGWPKQPLPPKWRDIDKWKDWGKGRKIPEGIFGLGEKGKPHSTKEGKEATMKRARERLRSKKGVGGIAKIIGKKAVDWIKKNRKTIKKEIYSPEGKKKTQDLTKKLQEGLKKPGHAKGGRIGLQHGSRPRPSGPHTWVRSGGAVLKGKKVGIQIK
tara:strand:- start:345 stop:1124 length:780 start_codon:yes stop_codon:yes gene_type:complete